MGLFKKIGKAVKKAVKDVGKVAKKVAPVALALTGVGGPIGALAAGALKTASKLKSTGTNVKKAAIQKIPGASTAALIQKALPPKGVTTAKRAPSKKPSKAKSVKKATTTKAKKKTPSKTTLAKLYAAYKGTDMSIPWEQWAQIQLGQ